MNKHGLGIDFKKILNDDYKTIDNNASRLDKYADYTSGEKKDKDDSLCPSYFQTLFIALSQKRSKDRAIYIERLIQYLNIAQAVKFKVNANIPFENINLFILLNEEDFMTFLFNEFPIDNLSSLKLKDYTINDSCFILNKNDNTVSLADINSIGFELKEHSDSTDLNDQFEHYFLKEKT